jgi:hypothetical protein
MHLKKEIGKKPKKIIGIYIGLKKVTFYLMLFKIKYNDNIILTCYNY